MRSVLVFAIYVLKNWKLSATPRNGFATHRLGTAALEIQTIQPEKYLKYSNEFEYAGHMLPILISYKVIHHTLTYRGIILSMITPIHITYSPTYLSVETDNMRRY